MSSLVRRGWCLVGGVMLAIGADQVEGPETEFGFLIAGLGVGVIAAALLRG